MSKEEITALAVRLFAVLLVFFTVRYLPTLYLFLGEQDPTAIWLMASIYLLLLVAAILMWKFPFAVARWISPTSLTGEQTAWNSEVLLMVGCSLVGIAYLYYAATDLLYWVMLWQFNQDVDGLAVELSSHHKVSMIVTVFEVALAIFLILGASGISKAIHRVRYSGTPGSGD